MITDQFIYVRVKRQQQTFCFLCHPEKETIGTIKQRIYTILTQQHPMKDVDVHNLHSINDMRIVIMAQSSTTSEPEQQPQPQQQHHHHQPPLVLLDSDTLEYVQQQQTELTKNAYHSTAGVDGNDPTTTTTTTTTNENHNNNNNNNNNSNHGMILYLLLPIMSKNDDADTVEEWETIQVVSTDI